MFTVSFNHYNISLIILLQNYSKSFSFSQYNFHMNQMLKLILVLIHRPVFHTKVHENVRVLLWGERSSSIWDMSKKSGSCHRKKKKYNNDGASE